MSGPGPLEKALAEKSLKDPEGVLALFIDIICNTPRNDFGEVTLESIEMRSAQMHRGFARYTGRKKFGTWPCTFKEEIPASTKMSFMGIFVSDRPVTLWDIKKTGSLLVWLAPYYEQPPDAVTLRLEHKDGQWKLSGFRISGRL